MQVLKSNPFFNHESVPIRNGTDIESQRGYVKHFKYCFKKLKAILESKKTYK